MTPLLPRGRDAWIALAVGLLALLACLALGIAAPRQALASYLVAVLFALSLSLGATALLMVHVLTSGAWGFYVRPHLLAATRVLPWLSLALVPLLLGAYRLYPWMHPGPELLADERFARQTWYLRPGFFLVRGIVFALAWPTLAAGLRRRLERPRDACPPVAYAVLGLVAYAITVTLAAVDWVASLQPSWHSSTFGLTFGTAQMLAAAAWVGFAAAGQDRREPAPVLRDLGSLLLMFVLAWSYLVFMDYLTAWIGDQPSEARWYLPRTQTSWKYLAGFVFAFELLVPFALLLSARAKRHAASLRAIAAALLAAHLGYLFWLVMPSLRGDGFALRWSDPLALLGVGAVWWAAWVSALRRRSEPLRGGAPVRPEATP